MGISTVTEQDPSDLAATTASVKQREVNSSYLRVKSPDGIQYVLAESESGFGRQKLLFPQNLLIRMSPLQN